MSLVKSLFLSGIYWSLASGSFIWVSYLMKPYSRGRMIGAIGLIILVLFLITILTKRLRNMTCKELVVAIPLLVSLAGGIALLWLVGIIDVTRFAVMVILLSCFIGAFNFLIYYEDIRKEDCKRVELMHARYLDYGRIFFTGLIVLLVSYLAWELQARITTSSQQITPAGLDNYIEALHLFFVIGIGAGLVLIGFHTKMQEIERLK